MMKWQVTEKFRNEELALFVKYNQNDQVKENEMGSAYGAN
jgi:hypothetical protein